MQPDLSGSTALVTGSDRGIGKGIAIELARAGCRVAINYYREPDFANSTVAELQSMGADAFAVQGDVSDAASVRRMFAEVIERFGHLNIHVNNAGVQTWKPLLDVTEIRKRALQHDAPHRVRTRGTVVLQTSSPFPDRRIVHIQEGNGAIPVEVSSSVQLKPGTVVEISGFPRTVFGTPVLSIWVVALLALGFTAYTPAYATITAVCAIFLYISYVLPTALGLLAHGRTWTVMGPWHLGRWYRPLAVVCVLGCGLLLVIGVQPPNEKALGTVTGAAVVLAAVWFGWERRRFQGPPNMTAACESAEKSRVS